MFDSQLKITERLNSLNLDEEVKQFFVYVMEFYKGHIKKLQAIIMSKQEEIDEAVQIKDTYEQKVDEMQYEIEQLKIELQEKTEVKASRNQQELEMTIQSLKDDLDSRKFDMTVYEDSIKNLRAQNESLKIQNNLLSNQSTTARNELAELKSKTQKGGNGNHMSDDIIREINNLKAEMVHVKNSAMDLQSKTATGFYQKPVQDIPVEIANEKPKRFHNRNEEKSIVSNPPLQRVEEKAQTVRKVVNDDDRPLDVGRNKASNNPPGQNSKVSESTGNMSHDELEGYLKFLLEKENDLQNKMWKLPAKSKSKVEKMEKSEVQHNLDDVTQEIESIKSMLKK